MTLHTRLEKAASAMRRRATVECPGLGTVTALHDADSPVPPPCRICGGWHVRVIEEVIVAPEPGGRTNPVTGRIGG